MFNNKYKKLYKSIIEAYKNERADFIKTRTERDKYKEIAQLYCPHKQVKRVKTLPVNYGLLGVIVIEGKNYDLCLVCEKEIEIEDKE